MTQLTRRRFVQGAAGTAGLLTLSGGLQYLEDAAPAQAGDVVGKEVLFRTGHSNNCDGACGHLVTVVDGKVRMIQGAPWDQTTISGKKAPKFDPRTCLRGIAQIQNTYSPDPHGAFDPLPRANEIHADGPRDLLHVELRQALDRPADLQRDRANSLLEALVARAVFAHAINDRTPTCPGGPTPRSVAARSPSSPLPLLARSDSAARLRWQAPVGAASPSSRICEAAGAAGRGAELRLAVWGRLRQRAAHAVGVEVRSVDRGTGLLAPGLI
jgi:hypothetical protein